MIEILTSGGANTIQDLGRFGYLSIGVSLCGAMDRLAFETGNALLGNAPTTAALEIAIFPFRLRFGLDTNFAVTGSDCAASLDGKALPPFWAHTARRGQELVLSPPVAGARAYIAVAGGFDVPEVLGSRSTDLKGGFGGHHGRSLKRGDRLRAMIAPVSSRKLPVSGLGALPYEAEVVSAIKGKAGIDIRVTPAAEFDDFTDEAIDRFLAADWVVSSESNRMGYRLSGPALSLLNKTELFSHGIVPGTVQVTPSGQPIIQLADANTCGGYPKIATVIEPDLSKLAQAPVGSRLRFRKVTIDAALDEMVKSNALLSEIRVTAELICS